MGNEKCALNLERMVTGAGRGWGRRVSRNKRGGSAVGSLPYPGDWPTSARLPLPEGWSPREGQAVEVGSGMRRGTWVGKG